MGSQISQKSCSHLKILGATHRTKFSHTVTWSPGFVHHWVKCTFLTLFNTDVARAWKYIKSHYIYILTLQTHLRGTVSRLKIR
jgi:hypothetical protein